MWTTRLLILGLVRWLQPVHGYDVLKELMSWDVEEWGRVKRGSIYHGLKKLTADGCLEVVSQEQVDKRPARTTYKITAKGEAEFQQVLRDKLWGLECPVDPFFIAWSFAPVLGPRETAAILRNRAALLRDQIAETRERILHSQSTDPRLDTFLPAHVRAVMELNIQTSELSAAWCDDMARHAEKRELGFDEVHEYSPEAVAAWRRHIEEMPSPTG